MEAKSKTINIIKETREVPARVSENRKKFAQIRKTLLEALKEEGKTIPQIAEDTKLSLPETTYYLMSLQKFGDVTVESMDEMEAYYIYKLAK